MHLVFFYYERFLFLQNRQKLHKRYDFVLARGSNIFEEICTETRISMGLKDAFKKRVKIKLKRVHTFSKIF